MTRRNSKWTRIYFTGENGKPEYYVRFTPDFMNLEATGFPHGLTLGITYAAKEQAEAAADVLDSFFDAMFIAIIDDHMEASDDGDDEYLKKLVGQLSPWLHCMSYNDSYFGEPKGLLKQTVRQMTKETGDE